MPIHFRLVGQTGKVNKVIVKPIIGNIKLNVIYSIFKFYEMTDDELSQMKFITESETVKDPDKEYKVDAIEIRVIHVFSINMEVRKKLRTIFNTHGIVIENKESTTSSSERTTSGYSIRRQIDSKFSQPLPDVKKEEDVLSKDDISEINKNIIKIFSDKDFKRLFKIYHNKPELFSLLYSFISSGDIIDNIETKEYDDEYKYKDEFESINSIGLGFSDNSIKSTLEHFEGHMNLTLRYLLCKNTVIDKDIDEECGSGESEESDDSDESAKTTKSAKSVEANVLQDSFEDSIGDIS